MRVVIESPYRAHGIAGQPGHRSRLFHAEVAKLLARRAALAGHSPLASHLMGPEYLDDDDPKERELGIELHLAWVAVAEELWIFDMWGVSPGMARAIERGLACPRLRIRHYMDEQIPCWEGVGEDIRGLWRLCP